MNIKKQRKLIYNFAKKYPDVVHGQDENNDYIFSLKSLTNLISLNDDTFEIIYQHRNGQKRTLLIEKIGHPAEGTKERMIQEWNQILLNNNSLFSYGF